MEIERSMIGFGRFEDLPIFLIIHILAKGVGVDLEPPHIELLHRPLKFLGSGRWILRGDGR